MPTEYQPDFGFEYWLAVHWDVPIICSIFTMLSNNSSFWNLWPVPGPKLLSELKSSMACCLSWQTADPLLCSVCLPSLAVAALPSEALFCLQGKTSRHYVLTCVVQNVHERLAIIKTYLTTLFQLTQNVSADTQVVIFYSDCLLMITNYCCPLSWKQRHQSLLTTCAVEKLG